MSDRALTWLIRWTLGASGFTCVTTVVAALVLQH